MAWAKRFLVQRALEEIGYAAYIYDLMPEQLESVLRSLDDMMAEWDALGIHLGYPLSGAELNANLDTETNVPDWSVKAIYTNLSIMIAPRFGKTVSAETKRGANDSYNIVMQKVINISMQQMPSTLPIGAGNKPWRKFPSNPFAKPPEDRLTVDNQNELTFE